MYRRRIGNSATILVVGVAACSREPPPIPHETATGASAAASAAPVPAAKPTEGEVRALVESWTKAQNTADFASYEKLYAPRFTGIKRSGDFTAQYGRKEWMADRKTMLVPGLVVEASDVTVRTSPAGARVEFAQHYRSPRYEDTGRKQLFVVSTADGPRIAREEMLASEVRAHAPAGRSTPIHAATAEGVYLSDLAGEFVPPKRGTHSVRSTHGYEAEAPLAEGALGADQKSFIGRSFTAYDGKGGSPCKAVVKSVVARSLVKASLDTVDDRKGYLGDDGDDAKSLARTVFALGRAYVFGVFESPCPRSVFAVQGSALRVYPNEALDAPAKDAARKAIRGLPAYTRLYLPSDETSPAGKRLPWDAGAEYVVYGAFRPQGAAPRTVLSIQGSMLCDSTMRNVTAVFDATVPSAPTVRGVLQAGDHHVNVFAALDADGDGELEYVSGPDGFTEEMQLLRRLPSGDYARESFFGVPSLICPC